MRKSRKQRPLDEETVRKQLGKTGNTPFEAAEIQCRIDGNGISSAGFCN